MQTLAKATFTKPFGEEDKNKTQIATCDITQFPPQTPYFSITYQSPECGGAAHKEIAENFPNLGKYIKWHLCSLTQPMHYIENTLYHVSNKDCWGLVKGEPNTYTYNVMINGELLWKDKEPYKLMKQADAERICELTGGIIVPVPCTISEGKERNLDYARSSAIWPDCPDEVLLSPNLKEILISRLPNLMKEFTKDMEELFGDKFVKLNKSYRKETGENNE